MADKDKLRFLTGQEANLKDKTLVRGQVYFAISSDTDSGKIYFDAPIDNNTTKRILMSSDHAKTADKATSADRATADSNGRKFTETYVSEIKLDNAGTTILYKYPDITTWKELKPKFLPLTGGTITGELYADSITAGDLLVNGSARFVNTILGNIETANQWKTARGFQIADSDAAHTSVSVNVNGSGNVVLKLPSTIKAALQGNADTATKTTNDSNNKKITDEYLHRVSNTSSTLNQFSGAPKYLLGIESFTDGGEVKWQSVDSVKVGSASGADKWNTARNFQVSDSDAAHTGTAVSVNGSKAIVLPLPATIKATLEGNASSANKVNHKYTLTLGKTKQTAFDGSADVSITITPESIGALSKDEASAGAAKWSTARTFYVADADASNTGTGVSVDGTKDITLKLPSTIKASITGHASEDLPLAGGTMTGNISYKGSKATNSMIRFLNNTTDTSGNGISIGGGGVTVIGAGESSQNLTPAANEEALYLTSDGSIKFYTYCDTIGNKRGVILDTSRNFYPDVNNSGSIGTSSNKWASMYATTFYGALSGTASHATSDIRGNAIINTYLTNVYAKSDDSSYLYKQVGPSSERSAELIGRYTPLDSDGLINMKYIPAAALERVVVVANQTAQYALTTANVQLGDVVKRNDTGQLYFVVDTNNLSNAGGYLQFTAGTATNVNWSGILNRPNIVGSASTKNIITLNDAKTVFTINRVNGDGTSDSYTLSPSFLPLAGGTMTGNIVFADSAFSANPTDTPGISWSGGTDSAKIFYRQTANNAGSLVLQVSDDGEEYIQFRHTQGGVVYLKPNTRELYPSANNTGSIGTTSYKWANMYATTFHGSLDGTANRATNDTNGKKITETYISEIKLDAAGTTIQFKAPDQTTYKEIKPKFLPLTGGTITGELYVDGGTTLASLLVNGDARFVNIIQGSISGNAGSATKWATAKAFYIADAEAKHTSSPQVNIDGSQSSYTLKLPSTIKATLEGNADTATKLTNLTEADKASSTNTWRRVWFAYDDNINGRPAYSDTFAYQSSSGTVKATKFQGDLVGNADSASKWKTARNFITNLGSETSASVDGSTGPYNLGVTGVLPVSHGGTGQNDLSKVSVGNADKLDNLHATSFKTRIVKEKTLGEAGWYRILNATTYSNTFLITFYGGYNYQPPTPVTFLVSHSYSTTKITQIGGCAYVGWITKIRAVHYNTSNFYIDIYFARTAGTNYVNFEVMPLDPNSRSNLTVVDFTLITDNITADAECITRVESYSDLAGKWETARTFITALNSESSASVDGSANVTMGVYGTLPVNHGGTGNTAQIANRAIYSETASKLSSSGHYMSNSKMAINSSSEPTEIFFVNGSTRLGRNRILVNSTALNGDLILTALGYKTGYPLYTDPLFKTGTNGISLYNNSQSTAPYTSVDRVKWNDAGILSPGTNSDYIIKIQNTQSGTSPDLGGFVQLISPRAGAIFIQIFRAMVPIGYTLNVISNPMGSGYKDEWITDNKGTGKWEWYARRVICGSEGTFADGGYIYLSGTAGVTWYLASCNCYDVTKEDYDGLKTRMADQWTTTHNFRVTDNGAANSGAWVSIDGSAPNYTLQLPSTIKATLNGNADTATHATYADYPTGFSSRNNFSWGSLGGTAYTHVTDWNYNGGEISFAEKDSRLFVQIDGIFYQNEGRHMVLDTNNYTSYAPTLTGGGASGTWNINITGLANKATNDGSGHNIEETYLKRDGMGVSNNWMTHALEIRNTSSASSMVSSGGAFHNGYVNLVLRGNDTTGVSGIAFTSSKGTTSINQPSDHAFIQYHPFGITTLAAEGTKPTLATSGEKGILVIGIGNDASTSSSGDSVYLQTCDWVGLKHNVANTVYTIPSMNTTVATANYPLITTAIAGVYTHNTNITMNGGAISITGTLSVSGATTIGGFLTVNNKVKIQNTTDSKNSQDSNASLAIQGGVSVAKQLSAKTIRIDGSSSDTIGSTTQGCTVHFNKTNNCIEFVFD